jgi:hypothetical protein
VFVYSRISLNLATGEVTAIEGFFYDGSVALCCGTQPGPSSDQKEIAGQQKQFYSTLMSNYQTQFAGQSAILQSLQNAFTPILQAGPGQYGFSDKEDAALRTQASAGTAGAYRMAAQATGQQTAARGGGNQFLPTGADTQLQQQNAMRAAEQESSQQLGITATGYAQGRENFFNSARTLGATAEMYNPTGYASQATGAGHDAFGSATQNWKETPQKDWGAILGGVGGGIVGSFFGDPAMGAQVGSGIFGAGNAPWQSGYGG